MTHGGFRSDADYFRVVADSAKSAADRKDLLKVEKEYRRLAKTDDPSMLETRAELWRKRAEECRTLADKFRTKICCEQLYRLADAYDQMAEINEAPQQSVKRSCGELTDVSR